MVYPAGQDVVFDPEAGRWRRCEAGERPAPPHAPLFGPVEGPDDEPRARRRRWPWVVGVVVALVVGTLLGRPDDLQDGTAPGPDVVGPAAVVVMVPSG